MSETGGEFLVVDVIISLVFLAAIVAIFSYILLYGFSFTSSSLCYTSSEIRNFFFQDLCIPSSNPIIHNFFCLSSTLANAGLEPPLLGCAPTVSSYSSVYPTSSIFTGISSNIATCFYQYGGYQNLSVLPNSAALCGVISIHTNTNFSFYNFTQFLKTESYTSVVNCMNYTPQQACPNYQEGYVCDKDAPSLCERSVDNYFTCASLSGYSPLYPGYYLEYIPLNGTGSTAANVMPSYLCDSTQGCSFNTTLAECTTPDGSARSCSQLYSNFCEPGKNGKMNCSVDYDPTTGSVVPPPSCTETESAKSTATENISFFDYFRPGINLFFSYKNLSNNKAVVVSASNKTLDLQNSTLYLVYLNTMTNTRFPPKAISLPPECAPSVWINNYPLNCMDYCLRSVAVYGSAIGGAAASDPGILTLESSVAAGAASVGYHYCSTNGVCSTLLPPTFSTVSNLLLTTSGLQNCISCILSPASIASLYLQSYNINFLGRNILFVCATSK